MGFLALVLVLKIGLFADELGFLGIRYSSPGMAPYPMFQGTMNANLLVRSERKKRPIERPRLHLLE